MTTAILIDTGEPSQMRRKDGHPRWDITSFVGELLAETNVDLLRDGVRVLAQEVMETEVSHQIRAAPYARNSERAAIATAIAPGSGTRGSARSSSRSRRSAPARMSASALGGGGIVRREFFPGDRGSGLRVPLSLGRASCAHLSAESGA